MKVTQKMPEMGQGPGEKKSVQRRAGRTRRHDRNAEGNNANARDPAEVILWLT
jgi:hypothetical protein